MEQQAKQGHRILWKLQEWGGGGGGGMGTKNCPLGIMDALPTHITLNFEVVFLQQKLSASQYISEMLSWMYYSHPFQYGFHIPHTKYCMAFQI